MVLWLVASLLALPINAPARPEPSAGTVQVRIVTDEADAVLAILASNRAKRPIRDSDWRRLFASEGYRRLKERERKMGRAFDDVAFKSFVLSAKLAEREQALTDALEKWKHADTTRAAGLALAYLPKGARIKAKIYPVIKLRTNSFVFQDRGDRAIFLYLDPTS